MVRFECEPGYYRTGLPVIHCMSNGSWSGAVPTCSRIRCFEFPEVRRQDYFTVFFDEVLAVEGVLVHHLLSDFAVIFFFVCDTVRG